MTPKLVLGILVLLSTSSALRLLKTTPEEDSQGKQSLFCAVFILDTNSAIFDLLEKQLKKCDDYAFLSTFDNAERKVSKVLEKAPPKSQQNWPIAEAMVGFFNEKADQFHWFLKIDPDCFLRPNHMRASLAQYSSTKAVAVGRPGRHSKLPLVGAVWVLSSTMVKQLQTKHLDPAEVAKGTWHSEDTLMSAWIPHAGGSIENAVNADHGCTTFSSTDREEIPSSSDIEAMKAGMSYTKRKPPKEDKKNMGLLGLGDICYSANLAAIHPVKHPTAMAHLMAQLDP